MKNDIRKIMPGAAVAYKDKFIFVDLWSNLLYFLDIETGESRVLTKIENEPFFHKDLFTDLVVGDDYLFCVPHDASHIVMYDLQNDEINYIELPNSLKNCQGAFKRAIYDKKNRELILLGYCIANIWIFSIDKKDFREIKLPISCGLYTSGIIEDDEIIIVSKATSDILSINRENDLIKIIKTSEVEKGYADIFRRPDDIIIVSFDTNKIYKLENEKLVPFFEGFKSNFDKWPHGAGVLNDKNKYIFALSQEEICCFDFPSKMFEYIQTGLISNKNESGIGKPVIIDDKLIIWFYETSLIVVFDYKKNKVYSKEIWSKERNNIKFDSENVNVVPESEEFNLISFLKAVGEM